MIDLRDKYLAAIAGAADEASLEDLRVQAVGKKGEISLKMRELGKMTPEERQTAGPALNALKDEINSALAAKKEALPKRMTSPPPTGALRSEGRKLVRDDADSEGESAEAPKTNKRAAVLGSAVGLIAVLAIFGVARLIGFHRSSATASPDADVSPAAALPSGALSAAAPVALVA